MGGELVGGVMNNADYIIAPPRPSQSLKIKWLFSGSEAAWWLMLNARSHNSCSLTQRSSCFNLEMCVTPVLRFFVFSCHRPKCHTYFLCWCYLSKILYTCTISASERPRKKTRKRHLSSDCKGHKLVIWKLGDFQIWNILLCYLNTVVLWLCITSKPISYNKSRWSDILL